MLARRPAVLKQTDLELPEKASEALNHAALPESLKPLKLYALFHPKA